jgi:hypothetical protein
MPSSLRTASLCPWRNQRWGASPTGCKEQPSVDHSSTYSDTAEALD